MECVCELRFVVRYQVLSRGEAFLGVSVTGILHHPDALAPVQRVADVGVVTLGFVVLYKMGSSKQPLLRIVVDVGSGTDPSACWKVPRRTILRMDVSCVQAQRPGIGWHAQ